MSCFAYMPGLYTLDYWHEKYKGQKGHKRFLLTKMIEILCFKLGHNPTASPEKKKQPFFPPPTGKNCVPDDPKVCVVVPCYVASEKDQKVLARLLDALMWQSQLAEVILVNDGSPKAVVPRHGEHGIRLEDNCGPAAARNVGMKTALERGADVIAFTDMDCVPEPSWLSALCETLISHQNSHLVSGKTKSFGCSWLDRYHEMNGTLNGRIYQGGNKLLYGTTCNLAIAATVGRNICFSDSFPLAAGEDIEFCFRANKAGYNIQYVESAVIAHDYFYRADSALGRWRNFIKQFRRYAKGEKLLLDMVPDYYDYYAHSEGISIKQEIMVKS